MYPSIISTTVVQSLTMCNKYLLVASNKMYQRKQAKYYIYYRNLVFELTLLCSCLAIHSDTQLTIQIEENK